MDDVRRAGDCGEAPADPRAFDGLARLAARVLGAPIAVVSLRQESGSPPAIEGVAGLPKWRELRALAGIGREVVASAAPLALADVRALAPFREDPEAVALGFASVLGLPLRCGGQALGMVCVIDRVPRSWADAEVATLGELADAAAELAVARRAAAAEARADALRRAEALRELQWNQGLLDGQRRILERIARGKNLAGTLEAIVRLLEEHSGGVIGSILLPDRAALRLRHAAAPSLPAAYTRQLDGLRAGPTATTLGAAVHRKAPADSPDIAIDPLWEADGRRALALGFGLRARWAAPILAEDGEVLGTFAAYAGAVRTPDPRDRRLLEIAVQLAGIAVERKRADRERARLLEGEQGARAEAEAANRAKDRFLAVLSHELRTPLTPVLVTVSAMLDDLSVPAELRPTMEMIRRSVELEARLIDDLLDVTRIVRGKLTLDREPTDIHALIRQTAEICRSDVLGGKIRLDLDLAAAGATVEADPARLQQVLWNLIKNAVKFTPAGGTVVVRTSNPEGPGPGRLAIEVADTGIGIDPEALTRIFNAFEQGEVTTTRRFGGLGLGLAISRSVIEAHGGTLDAVSSGAGRGSTFRVELATTEAPAVRAGPGAAPTPGARPRRSLSILLVEDDRDTLKVMARVLERRGHRVQTAADLCGGIALGEAGVFDLLISDIGLPDGTGHDLIRHLLKLRPLPGIALTGFGMDDDIAKSREAGFAAHLTKPIDFPKLEAIIQQVTREVDRGTTT